MVCLISCDKAVTGVYSLQSVIAPVTAWNYVCKMCCTKW